MSEKTSGQPTQKKRRSRGGRRRGGRNKGKGKGGGGSRRGQATDAPQLKLPPVDEASLEVPEAFADLGLDEICLKGVAAMGFEEPSPVQAEMIPIALQGKDGRAVFFNYVISVTPDCDCMSKKDMANIGEDVGILASTDPVAVDTASLDIFEQRCGSEFAELMGGINTRCRIQIEHAERIGMGSREYELIEIG